MAEYTEVIKQFKRMCRYYNGHKFDCPLYCKGHGCNISHCRMLAFDDKKFANVVMAWAAEHKEQVYPTWLHWLKQQGVIGEKVTQERIGGIAATIMVFNQMAYEPIPADIARKLGIEPKEG